MELLLTAIINDIVNQPALPNHLALVLDDYHLIENQAIHQARSFLIEHQPPQLHLVTITREDPPLPLARLGARQQMAEVRLADLQFTSDEVSVLLKDLMGLNLAPWHIEALADHSVPRSTFHPGYSLLELSWRQAHDQSTGHQNA